MGTLLNAVQAVGGTYPNAVLSALTANVGIEDHTSYTWSGLGQKLLEAGVSASVVLNARPTLQSLPNGGAMLDGCLTSGGFDCADPTNRALLEASEVIDPPDAVTIVNAMLAIGITEVPQWQILGLSGAPLLADVTATLSQIASCAQVVRFMSRLNGTITETSTQESVQAFVANNANWS